MKKFFKRSLAACLPLFLGAVVSYAQTSISGKVTDFASGETLAGVNIVVKGRVIGTITDTDGNYSLKVNDSPPLTLSFSFVGYRTIDVEVKDANTTNLNVQLEEQTTLGQEVVISASRVEESILKSPVTIEKVDLLTIQQTPAPEFYDALANVKGVQFTSSSLNFPQVNTRGFATIANDRFVQWVDGMDASAPILNFPTGNIVGIGELDAEGMELVPGAASALYGPNAFNGILLMTSKSPFDYQGLSAQAKVGLTSSDAQGESYPFTNFGIRYAKAFNNKLAFKINFSILDAEDWKGNDYATDRLRSTSGIDYRGEPDFDGVNTYGDETIIFNSAGYSLRRTGFKEEDLLDDYSAKSIKGDAALHYRITDKIEFLYNYRYGSGNAIYQGDSKYALRDFTQQFHKIEFRGDNFFVRGYRTATDAGDSYNLLALGSFVNEALKPSQVWVPDYLLAYQGNIQGVPAGNHQAARAFADRNVAQPGSAEFDAALKQVGDAYFQKGGAKFIDESRIWHGEFNYNFKNLIDFAELMVGGNFRRYDLFTNGTILNENPDAANPDDTEFDRIKIDEYGFYTQIAKTFNALKLTGSLRYDKNENFDGLVTPRISAVYTVAENHNIRASFQTGFRNPQTQAQFIYFPASDATLLGSTEANAARYGVHNGGSYTRDSYRAYLATGGTLQGPTGTPTGGNPALLVKTNVPYVKAEQLKALEVGYKGLFNSKFLLDLNGYYNIYNDLLGSDLVASDHEITHRGIARPAGTVFSLYSNAPDEITSYGIGLGLSYNLPKGYVASANYNYAEFDQKEIEGRSFNAGFNTPNNKFNISVGNRRLTKNFGFNINFRWQEEFEWFSSYGMWVVPEFGTLDAQLSYKIPNIKSIVKLGGSNLTQGDYRTNLGGPFVGQQYYIAITFDEFLK
jgi:iron complex outermembrane recepter protein